jgi:DNA repair ATPase RecN
VDEIERKAVADSEKRIKEFTDVIQSCQQKLQQLGENSDEKNVKVVSSEKLAERQKIQNELKAAQTDLRHLQAQRRQAVEEMRWTVEAWNLFGAPSIILVIAVALAILRRYHAAKWAARRNGQ